MYTRIGARKEWDPRLDDFPSSMGERVCRESFEVFLSFSWSLPETIHP